MTDWLKKWNERYSQQAYAFGETPNVYFKSQLEKLPTGKALFAAEGEGRNAVFAATLGWQVSAFDISIEGQKKARQLAQSKNVAIDYQVGDLADLSFEPESFDMLALIYAHFPADRKSHLHQQLSQLIRPKGFVIFEAFSKKHLPYREKNEAIGGPRNLDSLFSIDEIRNDFNNYDIIELNETEAELNEGLYHNGLGHVVRFVGQKR